MELVFLVHPIYNRRNSHLNVLYQISERVDLGTYHKMASSFSTTYVLLAVGNYVINIFDYLSNKR